MKFIKEQIEYVKNKPAAVGVSAVLATVSLGMALSFALGFATPTQAFAQFLPPCCTVPVVPIVPIIPIIPITPPPPVIQPVITDTPAPSDSDSDTDSDTFLPPCCTVPDVPVVPTIPTVPVASTPVVVADVPPTVPAETIVPPVTPTPTPPSIPAPVCSITLSVSTIQSGGSATLSWTGSNGSSMTISGIGSVNPAGGSVTIHPTATTAYSGEIDGAGGTTNCGAIITVTPPNNPPPPPTPPACTLNLSTSGIQTGGSATLSWSTTNANSGNSITIDNGIGAVAATGGSVTIHPTSTTTYHGTVNGAGGTANCQTTITVTPPNGPPPPSCTLNLSVSSIQQGDSATLSWSTANAGNGNSITIDNGIGDVNPNGGSVTINPTSNTTYHATVNGIGGTASCVVTITVTPPNNPPPPGCVSNCGGGSGGGGGHGGGGGSRPVHVTLTQAVSQPLSYVYLSQIPYTGLDLGPIGTFVYWLLLILWSAALAYLAIFKLVPFIKKQFIGFGHAVSVALNTEAVQEENRFAYAAPAAAPSFAPQASSFAVQPPAPASYSAAPEAASAYSAYQGFRSFGRDGALTIDDIVKGLSRQPVPAAQASRNVEPIYENVEPIQASAPSTQRASVVPKQSQGLALPAADVPQFIGQVLAGNRDDAFGMIRSIVREGGDAEHFLTQVAVALDDAYRARVEGSTVHPEIARVTEGCATSFLEKLVTSFSTGLDSTYSQGITGAKLAVARALAVVEG